MEITLLGNEQIESLYLLREVSWTKCMCEKERLRERQRKTKSQRIITFFYLVTEALLVLYGTRHLKALSLGKLEQHLFHSLHVLP